MRKGVCKTTPKSMLTKVDIWNIHNPQLSMLLAKIPGSQNSARL